MRLDTIPRIGFADPAEHLQAEFHWLEARLADHILRMRDDGRFTDDPMRGLFLSEHEVLAGLSGLPRQPEAHDPLRGIIDLRVQAGQPPPLYRVAQDFGLDVISRDALMIVVAAALDRRFQNAIGFAHNDVSRTLPTIGLLLDLLAPDDRNAALGLFSPEGLLIDNGLLRVADGQNAVPLTDRILCAGDRIVFAIAGQAGGIEPALRAACSTLDHSIEDWAADLMPLHLPQSRILVIEGRGDIGQRAYAARRAKTGGLGLIAVDFERAQSFSKDMHELGTALAREARLESCALLVEIESSESGHAEGLIERLSDLGIEAIFAVPPNLLDLRRTAAADVQRCALPEWEAPDRRGLWQRALGTRSGADPARLAWSTRLGPAAIAAVRQLPPENWEAASMATATRQLPAILELVKRAWLRDDLLVPPRVARELDELTATVKHWPKVVGEWGFGAGNPQARQCLALFSGPSGTGKTMAAGIVANEAGVALYRANLASVFDKYIGETEKHIDRLFSAAADAGVALLFDEADVLFGARTEVQDSHDRYANLSTAYLLQRVETHEGLVILSSNMPCNMDDAFARRLTCTIHFPLPSSSTRLALWEQVFPPQAQRCPDLDLAEIAAVFELSGGAIRNAALSAAYLAASQGTSIGMPHLLRAIERELEKTGRNPIPADFGSLATAR
ncbi:ATP-binding protein [Alteraurantiacibacter aquimixticola]|uniref:ATP-binding protein n=1 Tax=Alteraurantiacibacter aquimixticola TaxID=2489173 RepID=A0A4T3F4I9_9SPHN|nr:ATP-binding protein [Alteraurantiacibacter aquimixticola]TIX49623.1 ATP-binding protein [Alteraurantiacibacter aquimixticola]